MNEINTVQEKVTELVLHQLGAYFIDIDAEKISRAVPYALNACEENFRPWKNPRVSDGEQVYFNPYHSVTWMIFLYRLSHILGTDKVFSSEPDGQQTADQVYYLNKIMHSTDWYHQIELPVHFSCEHPLGSVLGRAEYFPSFSLP